MKAHISASSFFATQFIRFISRDTKTHNKILHNFNKFSAIGCVYDETSKIIESMHCNIPCIFDFWADPAVRLLLLKSSTVPTKSKYH